MIFSKAKIMSRISGYNINQLLFPVRPRGGRRQEGGRGLDERGTAGAGKVEVGTRESPTKVLIGILVYFPPP